MMCNLYCYNLPTTVRMKTIISVMVCRITRGRFYYNYLPAESPKYKKKNAVETSVAILDFHRHIFFQTTKISERSLQVQ